MDSLQVVYSEKRQCQDCYKCLRHCPVKAIRVAGSVATVIGEECIACGECVKLCPSGAKRSRDDVKRARLLVGRKSRVILSLAPSFASEFPGIEGEALVAAFRRLGFFGVSETALGAEEYSAAIGALLDERRGDAICARPLISSACPTAVAYLRRRHPRLLPLVAPVLSPMLAHCKLLKAEYGEDVGVVFAGPCIGKKIEADEHPELCDLALGFDELRRWLREENIELASAGSDPFIPRRAAEGALYPIEGGMNRTLASGRADRGIVFASVSGLDAMDAALSGLESWAEPGPACAATASPRLFVELQACSSGCVNGPLSAARDPLGGLLKTLSYAASAAPAAATPGSQRAPRIDLSAPRPEAAEARRAVAEEELRSALLKLGKRSPEDELNCGGCGYDSCRELAAALLDGRAESLMCVSRSRELAQKKANALIRTMPFGVVILDEELRVVECNKTFASLFGAELAEVYDEAPGLAGATPPELTPFREYFLRALKSGEDLRGQTFAMGERMFSLTVFSIDPGHVAGALFADVTQVELSRAEVAEKARKVIRNTLASVQDIAFRLGRNAAESEVILNSIIEAYGPTKADALQVPPSSIEAARR